MNDQRDLPTRRGLLKTVAATAAVSIPILSAEASGRPGQNLFPDGFLWGAATAGHQVEGNNVNSDLWQIEHVTPTLFDEPSGDACDSLNRWQTDIDLVKTIGLNSYRFSLEWARIEPAESEFSIAMLDFYQRMVAACHARGITPLVTFNHFSAPRWFAARGGWESAGSADLYARYCDRVTRHMGDLLVYASTLNEPDLLLGMKWIPQNKLPPNFYATQSAMLAAAGTATNSKNFSVANFGAAETKLANMLEGHKKAYAAIKNVSPAVEVGVNLAIDDDQAVGPNSMRDQRRESVYGAWLEAAKTGDFIGVQNYERRRLDDKGIMPPPTGARLTESGSEFYPDSLEGAVRYAHEATGLPVIVTENGINAADDTLRQAFIPLAVRSLHSAIASGVPVKGYVHWSLIDNWEWVSGYKPRYGLATVDRTNFQRTLKPSAAVLGKIAKNNAV